jgi:6-phosphogluconolactonase
MPSGEDVSGTRQRSASSAPSLRSAVQSFSLGALTIALAACNAGSDTSAGSTSSSDSSTSNSGSSSSSSGSSSSSSGSSSSSSGSSSSSSGSSSSSSSSSSSGGGTSTPTYSVGGTISGLSGSGLTLLDNASDSLAVSANGAFSFAASVASGAAYAVTVSAQPTNPSQYCAVTNGTGTASANVTSVTVSCQLVSRFVYATNNGNASISGYAIDPSTGELTAMPGSPFATGNDPASAVVTPGGKFVYVTVTTGLLAYSADPSSGALSPLSASPYTVSGPGAVTTTADGNFLFATNFFGQNPAPSGSTVLAYQIDTNTGALNSVSGSPFTTGAGTNPFSLAVDPAGKYLYVADEGGDNTSVFGIDSTSGALTEVSGSPFAAGSAPQGIAVTANGGFVYVANASSGSISGYSVNSATGNLTPIANSPFSTGTYFPHSLAVDPGGNYLYLTSPSSGSQAANVLVYAIDAQTGALTFSSSVAVAAGATVNAGFSDALNCAIDSGGRFLYVTNPGANTISAYAVDLSAGTLMPIANSPYAAGNAVSGLATSN